MLPRLARLALLAAALAAPALPAARADDLAEFNAAVEAAAAHNRVAIGYLRTGNVDLAAIEIDRLRQAWQRVGGVKRPEVFDGKLYVKEMTDIAMRLVTADMLLNLGKPDNARASLVAVRDDLHELRKSAGVEVLADCVHDAGESFSALSAYDDPKLDFAKAGADLAARTAAYGKTLARCDGMAPTGIRQQPEFRRLIDGAQTSVANIDKAIAARDGDLLHRVLDELRAIDNLMSFRFG